MNGFSRRHFLSGAVSLAALAVMRPALAQPAPGKPRFAANPFLFGVASGDPLPDSVVLWTRLGLDLADPESWGLSEAAYRVVWSLHDAQKPSGAPIASGETVAAREKGYAVHVEVGGLEPGRRYRFSFRCGDEASAEGLTKTAPTAESAQPLRFGFCSCSEYENHYFHAYRAMAEEDFDFAVHLGDYIYELPYEHFRNRFNRPTIRRLKFDRYDAEGKPIYLKTLGEFRRRYAEYRMDPDLQEAHRVMPWIVTWDDHEVENDYAGSSPVDQPQEGFAEKRINAYRAYFENMPIRLSALPEVNGLRQLYRRFDFGRLLRLHVLDERQYRDVQACRAPFGQRKTIHIVPKDCPELGLDDQRQMLGEAQFAWLAEGLETSPARWNVLAQGVPFSPAMREGKDGGPATIWHDSWAGYPWAQANVMELMARQAQKNPVIISGDIHSHWVNCVRRFKADPVFKLALPSIEDAANDARFAAIAPEFVCTSISSNLRDFTEDYQLARVPHLVKYHDGNHHGYVAVEATGEAFTATMVRMMADAQDPSARPAFDRSERYGVTPGQPEPRRIA